MADSARIHVNGFNMYLLLDPSSGTLTQPANTLTDTQVAEGITITASGGAVTVTEVEIEKKYPFVDLDNNQFKLCVALSRRIKHGETVTVSYDADLCSDGTRGNSAGTDLGVSNLSYVHDNVSDLITSSSKIVYVDPTGGNDTNAAAVNSGNGYYTTDDTEVGTDPTDPDGSVVAYATIAAAIVNCPTDENNIMLFKRGESFSGDTQYAQASSMLPARRGASATQPFVFAAYGTGTQPQFNPTTTDPTVRGSRVKRYNLGDDDSWQVYSGLDFQYNGNCVEFDRITGTDGLIENIYFHNCTLDAFSIKPSSTSGYLRLIERVVIDECVRTNGNSARNALGSSVDFRNFTCREWTVCRSVNKDIGQTALEHAMYPKMFSDLVFCENIVDHCSGNGVKADSCWGYSIRDNITTRGQQIAENSSNGDINAGFPSDRSEDTETGEYPDLASAEGAYSKWGTVKRNVSTDTGNPYTNQVILSGVGQTVDTVIKDNLLYSEQDIQATGIVLNSNEGSTNGYTRDGRRASFEHNTIVLNANGGSQTRAVWLEMAEDDSFGASGGSRKGHHDLVIKHNVFFIGEDLIGGDINIVEIEGDTFADADTANRNSMVMSDNSFFRASNDTISVYDDYTDSYSNLDDLQDALNATTAGSAVRNYYLDPGFANLGRQVSDVITGQGYTDLDDWADTRATEILTSSVDLPAIIDVIISDLRTSYAAENLIPSLFSDEVPGILGATGIVEPGSGGNVGPHGYYNELTITNPDSNLTDFPITIDLGDHMNAAWWTLATGITDGRKIRVTKEDGTELPFDCLAFDAAANTGRIRAKWTGTLSSSGTQKIRVFCPADSNRPYFLSDTYGQWNTYADKIACYLPLEEDFEDRTRNMMHAVGPGTLVAGDSTGQIGNATEFDPVSSETLLIADHDALDATTGMSIMGWVNGAQGLWNGFARRVESSDIYMAMQQRGSSNDMSMKVDDGVGTPIELRGGDFTGGWHHYAGIASTTAGMKILENAVSIATDATNAGLGDFAGNLAIGIDEATGNAEWDGSLQEIQYHVEAPSDDWVKYEYDLTNNNAGMFSGVVGGIESKLVVTELSVNASGTTIDIVSELANSEVWQTPFTGVGKTLTINGSVSGIITATIPDSDVGVVVSSTDTIADTATFTANLDKTVQGGETLTVLICDQGIIEESGPDAWESSSLTAGTAVTNNVPSPGGGGNVYKGSASRYVGYYNNIRRLRRMQRR